MPRNRRAQSALKWIITGTIIATVALGGGAIVVRLAAPQVVVTDAVEGPVVQAFYSTGTIQPERDFPIKANVAGTIQSVQVDKGDVVKAGQPLAVVSDPELTFTVRKAEADLIEKQ